MGCSRGAREPVVRYCVGAGPRAHPAAGARAVDGRRPPRGAAGARARTHGRVPARRARGGLHEAAGAPSRRQPGRPATDARHGSGTGTCDRRPSRCWRRWATRELPSHRSSRSASWRCWRGGGGTRTPKRGDSESARYIGRGCPLPPQEHLPQDRRQQACRRGALCALAAFCLDAGNDERPPEIAPRMAIIAGAPPGPARAHRRVARRTVRPRRGPNVPLSDPGVSPDSRMGSPRPLVSLHYSRRSRFDRQRA